LVDACVPVSRAARISARRRKQKDLLAHFCTKTHRM
jgi:hypothetical protein